MDTEGPVRRSDTTRAAILQAARERFASDGYERATIRAIAADANIDPAMVMRYFGSKDKLFAVAAEFELQLPDLGTLPADGLGEILVGHFLRRWDADDTLVALLRAAVTNAAAAERMRSIFGEQLGPLVVERFPVDAPQRAGMVATQLLGLALCRYVLRLPPVVAMSAEQVTAWIGPTIQRYLT